MGVEVIAITAGEAQHPEQSIPRAMRTMVLRLILFYLLAISVMLMMTPWNQIAEGGGGIAGSPFVRAFTAVGIPYAAGVMNLVVISRRACRARTPTCIRRPACCSRCRDRVRAGLGLGGVSRRRAASGRGRRQRRHGAWRSCWPIFSPDVGFLALFGTAVAGMLFIWIVILLTYLRFRASLTPNASRRCRFGCPRIACRGRFGIVDWSAIAGTTFFVDGLRYTVPSFLPFLAVISIFYAAVTRRERVRRSRDVRRYVHPGVGRRRGDDCSAMSSGSRFISIRMPSGKIARFEGVGRDTGDAIAAFADEPLHVPLVCLEGVPDAPLGELQDTRCPPKHLLGPCRRSEAACRFEPRHQDAEIAHQLEARPAERPKHLVLRFLEEPKEVAEPDDAGGVGVGPMHAHVHPEEICHRGTLAGSSGSTCHQPFGKKADRRWSSPIAEHRRYC